MTIAIGLEVPQAQIEEVCQRYQIVEMAIFGSAARDDFGPDSDIDILVEFAPGVMRGWDYFGLEQGIGQDLWPTSRLGHEEVAEAQSPSGSPARCPRPLCGVTRNGLVDAVEAADVVAGYLHDLSRDEFLQSASPVDGCGRSSL
jgi:hypothetical protein